jgi:hypothetical protein
MSDKSRALRAKSDEVRRSKTGSPMGQRQHGRVGVVARRSQNNGYAPSSRLADRARGAGDGTARPGIAGH